MQLLSKGTFVRVRPDHPNPARAGLDGMVMEDSDSDDVALIFHADRHNEIQRCVCVGRELWERVELDMESACPLPLGNIFAFPC